MSNHQLLKRLDLIKEQLIQTNEHDYKRVMSDLEYLININNMRKKNERMLRIKRRKEILKLKEMSEYRENIQRERVKKIEDKEKIFLSRSSSSRRNRYLSPIINTKEKLDRIKKEEENFCAQTEQKINNHLESLSCNHDLVIKEIGNKYMNINKTKQKKVDTIINNYKQFKIEQENAYHNKKANQMQYYKDLINSNRESQNKKKQKLKFKLIHNIERRNEIYEENKKKCLDIIKKINNSQSSENIQKNINLSERRKVIENLIKKQNNFNDLQQENLNRLNMEKRKKNLNLIQKEYDIINWIREVDYAEYKDKKKAYKNTISKQIELDKKLTEMVRWKKNMDIDNILRKNFEERIQLFYQKKREEKERKEKEEEEKLKAKGKL